MGIKSLTILITKVYIFKYYRGGHVQKYYKEKQIYCGKKYLEVDFISCSGKKKRGRPKKEYMSAPKQKNLNDKNARRCFTQLINTNFYDKDHHVTCTYDQKNLPSCIEEAVRWQRTILDD